MVPTQIKPDQNAATFSAGQGQIMSARSAVAKKACVMTTRVRGDCGFQAL